ncbi:AI-2E family transporter [Muricoccus pecuniae]|uniref:Putative PurR-regulated permease PerM n=1 Tax=Muricoccus pecuniae TaxID=693023 RepID=A0A840Y6R0_9PROT|nr:AI-2E family transporter [Roseomonas pecuniae]MBB5695846.1 putative PurR-regulated permease PerM [Roseomonas pecuniae]
MSDDKQFLVRLIGVVVLVALLAGCFFVLRPFLSSLLWAVILAFTTWPVYRFLLDRGIGPGPAAGLMVVAMMIVIGLPLALAAPTSREEIEGLRNAVQNFLTDGLPALVAMLGRVPVAGPFLQERFGAVDLGIGNLFSVLRPYAGSVAQTALGLVLAIVSGVAELLIAILLSFFFFRDGPRLAEALIRMAERIAGERGTRLVELTGAVTQGVIYGLLGTAVVQGAMTTFGLWLSGVPQPALLGILAGVISILPIGAPVVWIPATIWLLANGSTGWGIFMGLYGAFGISSVDNFIRPWLISRGADLPLLLTLLGALGGALAFGLLGLFLGPVLLAVAYTLIRDWAADGQGRTGPRPIWPSSRG